MALLWFLAFFSGLGTSFAQSTFTITGVSPATVPAGANGIQLELTGTLPTLAQQSSPGYQACFYTGYGSTAGLALSNPDGTTIEPLTVPASTIQAIPPTAFTASNNFAVRATVYFIPINGSCTGQVDSSLSNAFGVNVVAPAFGAYTGPTAIPQINAATSVQAAPLALTLPGSGYFSGPSQGTTYVSFGTFGSSLAVASTSGLYVPVPATFSVAPPGTTASLGVCNTYTLAGQTTSVCTTPTPAITLTVSALTPSSATITATPTPVTAPGQTVLTAQFTKSANAAAANAGAPSGIVSFIADGNALPTAKLILDKTATFVAQTTMLTPPTAATPVISPAAGSYTSVQTITITDTTPSAAIYYTLDGSTPTTSSTLYAAPFSLVSSGTVKAIAAAAGVLNSVAAASAYTITLPPATHLGFQVQPVDTALNSAITPAVQVALLDTSGTVVPYPAANVTIAIGSNPGNGTLAGTATVATVNGIATFSNLAINRINATGTAYTLNATSGNLTGATSTGFNITPPPITMTVQSELVGIASTLTGSFTLGVPAPAGGLVVTLTSGTPANVTIAPATVTVPAGQTTGAFTYNGVAAGDSTLKATAPGYQNGTVLTTGTAAQVSLGMIPNVAPAQMQSLALSLATPAPAGGTTVTFTIANKNIATVTQSVFVPAAQQTAAANPQITGVLIGTTTVTANAPGYAPATRPVNVTVTANFNPGTTYINLTTSTNTILQISAPAPPGGITFTLSSDSPATATVPASVTIVKGATSVNIPITGVVNGTTTIRADSAGIVEATGTVVVTSNIGTNAVLTGFDLEVPETIYLPVAPANPVTFTVTSNNPAVAKIATAYNTTGQTTLTFPSFTNQAFGFYVQGVGVGTTTLTISAPGYTSGTTNITVDRTGFAFYYTNTRMPTTYSTPDVNYVYPVPLNADGSIASFFGYTFNPGSPAISLPISSSLTTVGTVNSPVVFNALDTQKEVDFAPVALGTANVTVGNPPASPVGFAVPTSGQTYIETVVTPALSLSNVTTAAHLTNGAGIYLPVAPPSAITVTVTSSAPLVASLSSSSTAVGTTTATFAVAANSTYVGTLYVQGQTVGTSTLTISAPGYTGATSTVTVHPTGFFLNTGTFTTTTFTTQNTITAFIAGLNPQTLGISEYYLPVNPGNADITVATGNSTSATGTLVPASFTFPVGSETASINFKPIAAGTTNLSLVTPTGFSTANQYQQITATVTAPAISIGGSTTAIHLTSSIGIYLPVAPPSAVDVTVTSSAPLLATLSSDPTVVGTTSVTFHNVTGTYAGSLYIQGQSAGTLTLTQSATGYTSGTSTVTVHPVGFFWATGSFTTSTFSGVSNLTAYIAGLDPQTLAVSDYYLPLSVGVAPAVVPITDSATSVGTIMPTALTISPGQSSNYVSFQPVSAGTANLTLNTPVGYSTASQYQQITATVTAPVITVSNVTTAVKLDQSIGIYLPVAPPNPVTVTVTSSGPAIATISTDGTVVGGTTVTFLNVTSTSVGTIYVQGQGLGTSIITETAPGYIDGSGTVTVEPAGFSFYYGNPTFTDTAGGSATNLTVYPFGLTPGTLVPNTYPLQVNPGLGNINVTVTSSDTSVGTISTSPLAFTPASNSEGTTFVPLATGTSTITIETPTGFTTPSQSTTGTATVQ